MWPFRNARSMLWSYCALAPQPLADCIILNPILLVIRLKRLSGINCMLTALVTHLFYILHPKSKGNFNHFRKIVEYSTQFHPEYRERVMMEPVKAGLGSRSVYPILYWAFSWLHEPLVANALFPIIFSASHRTSSGLWRKDIFETLSTADWLELLVSMMTDEGT
jgi:hypothetical protein